MQMPFELLAIFSHVPGPLRANQIVVSRSGRSSQKGISAPVSRDGGSRHVGVFQ